MDLGIYVLNFSNNLRVLLPHHWRSVLNVLLDVWKLVDIVHELLETLVSVQNMSVH